MDAREMVAFGEWLLAGLVPGSGTHTAVSRSLERWRSHIVQDPEHLDYGLL